MKHRGIEQPAFDWSCYSIAMCTVVIRIQFPLPPSKEQVRPVETMEPLAQERSSSKRKGSSSTRRATRRSRKSDQQPTPKQQQPEPPQLSSKLEPPIEQPSSLQRIPDNASTVPQSSLETLCRLQLAPLHHRVPPPTDEQRIFQSLD